MKKITLFLFSLLACSFFISANAQTRFSGWAASFNTIKIGKKTSLHTDLQWRSSDQWEHTQTVLVRSGLNFHVNKRLTLTGGYAYIYNRRVINGISGNTPEHRIWEQLLYTHKLGPVFVAHRFRLEQRFIGKTVIQNNELKTDEFMSANRFRYFIRNILPLQKQEGAAFKRGAFAALQDEVFLNIGNKSNVNGKTFDQNRLYLAMGYRLRSSFDLELGYMNQYISGTGSSFINNHILQVAGYLRL